jgi:hypothetical protein
MSRHQASACESIDISRAVRSPLAVISAWCAFLLLIIFNFALQPLTEPDFGWHLRTGLDVLQNGLPLPPADPYSHTMSDWPWVEHAWLTDVLVAGIYSTFGALGVILLFAAVTIGAWLMGAAVASTSLASRLLACALSLWVALPYLGARTQLITLLGLAVLSLMLKRWREGSASVRWWIPPFFLLWANLHGGFVAGLLLLSLVIVTTASVRWLVDRRIGMGQWDEPLFSRTDVKRLAVIFAVSACVTVLNPYGWRLYGEIVDSLSNRFMLDTLQEWQPLSTAGLAGRRYAMYLAGLGVAMALWYRRIEPVRWAVGVVFLGLSFRHMRNIPFVLIVSLPLCAEMLSEGFTRLCRRWPLGDLAGKRTSFSASLLLAATLLWLGPEHVQRVVLSGTRPEEYFKTTSYPIEAVEWMRANQDQMGQRLYNDYGYGGFLLWWLPGTRIFIDGRMPAWRNGERAILQDYMALTGTDPDFSILTKYSVDCALVKKQTPLEEGLAKHAAWSRVYDDGKTAIYRLKATMRAF